MHLLPMQCLFVSTVCWHCSIIGTLIQSKHLCYSIRYVWTVFHIWFMLTNLLVACIWFQFIWWARAKFGLYCHDVLGLIMLGQYFGPLDFQAKGQNDIAWIDCLFADFVCFFIFIYKFLIHGLCGTDSYGSSNFNARSVLLMDYVGSSTR